MFCIKLIKFLLIINWGVNWLFLVPVSFPCLIKTQSHLTKDLPDVDDAPSPRRASPGARRTCVPIVGRNGHLMATRLSECEWYLIGLSQRTMSGRPFCQSVAIRHSAVYFLFVSCISSNLVRVVIIDLKMEKNGLGHVLDAKRKWTEDKRIAALKKGGHLDVRWFNPIKVTES